ncbi:hypothetical protein K402DRAFT_196581, partial [Aulographum hederae CBS 113979]
MTPKINPLRRITRAISQQANPQSPKPTSSPAASDTSSETEQASVHASEADTASQNIHTRPLSSTYQSTLIDQSFPLDFELNLIDTMTEISNTATIPKLMERMDWFVWYPSVKTYAESLDVWRYIDVKTTNVTLSPLPPTLPPNGNNEAYRSAMMHYNLWAGIRLKISQVRSRIENTLAQSLHYIIEGESDARACLIALQANLAPEERDHVQVIREAFNELCKGPVKSKEDEWIQKWTKVTQRAITLKIENMGEQQLCIAFIDASRLSNPAFYQMMKGRQVPTQDMARTRAAIAAMGQALFDTMKQALPEQLANTPFDPVAITASLQSSIEDEQLTMSKLQGLYRSQLAKQPYATTSSAFATLNGQSDGKRVYQSDSDDTPKPKTKKTARLCVCGNKHNYRECWYLFINKAPSAWTPRPDTETAIIRTISGSRAHRSGLEKIFREEREDIPRFLKNLLFSNVQKDKKKASQGQKSSEGENTLANATVAMENLDVVSNGEFSAYSSISDAHGVFATTAFISSKQSIQSQKKRFNLDTAANRHFCNDAGKFETFDPDFTREPVLFGDSSGTALGEGTVKIAIDRPDGSIGTLILRNVLYVPNFHTNLISAAKLEDRGFFWDSESKSIWKRH